MRFQGFFAVAALTALWPLTASAQTQTLTIHMAGEIPGTVNVRNPGPTSCSGPGPACSMSVQPGTLVRLDASVPDGTPGKFSAGTGPAAGCGFSTCAFTMTTSSVDITATFSAANAPFVSLAISHAGDGAGTVFANSNRCQNFDPAQSSDCTTVYILGSTATVEVLEPAAGSRFSGYAGSGDTAGCGAAAQCSVTLSGDATVTAAFHAITSIAVAPSPVAKFVAERQTFTANGTFSNGVTEPVPIGGGTWTTKTGLTAARFAPAAAAANGKLYALGGNISTGPGTSAPSASVEVYDPVANTWTPAAPMPTPRAGLAAVTVDGLIYAIGGSTVGGGFTAAVERYDPVGNTWLVRAPMPTARGFLAAAAVNGLIYVVGGETAGGMVGTLEAYDPIANTWTAKTPMPTARGFLGAGAVNGILYTVGGNGTGEGPHATVEAYDPVANAWFAKPPMPSASTGLAVVVVEDVLYAVAGLPSGLWLSSMYAYDAVTNAWVTQSDVPTTRSQAAAAALGGRIYLIGGLPVIGVRRDEVGTTLQDKVEAFAAHLRWSSSAPGVMRITQNGIATAASIGSATIVASAGSITCTTGCATATMTAAPHPIATTDPATNIRPVFAQLNGVVNPSGFTTSAFFEYGLTTAYGTSTGANPIGSGMDDVPQTFIESHLACSTTYHFRMNAVTDTTTVNGADAFFTTPECRLATPGDFTGDGEVDIALYRPGSGIWSFYLRGSLQWGLPGDVPVAGDYDANGVVDIAVYQPSSGVWYIRDLMNVQWGVAGDIPVPADYDGDAATDVAIFRPSEGAWYVRGQFTRSWGLRGDIPVPADYDGDGKADLAVFRPSTGVWLIAYSATGFATTGTFAWGDVDDTPALGDIDGDHRADLVLFHRTTGVWHIAYSSGSLTNGTVQTVGAIGDVPLALDMGLFAGLNVFPADGRAELVMFRPSSGTWFIRNVFERGTQISFGGPGDVPAARRPVLPSVATSDADGDAAADLTVFRPSTGMWFTARSSSGFGQQTQHQWGLSGDVPVQGDYDGDRRADLAIFRPGSALWFLSFSATGFSTTRTEQWGLPGDVPVAADYDGDGRMDIAIFRPSNGVWYVRTSSSDYAVATTDQWGLSGDVPLPADYDGDGRADIAVFRPSTGTWYLKLSSSGAFGGTLERQWGLAGDLPIAADFDGDGIADLGIFRPSTGTWYVLNLRSGTTQAPRQWGLSGDVPVAADYDGDGVADLAIFRPSTGTWFLLRSTRGVLQIQWGLPGDEPLMRIEPPIL